jgi:NitT/TauT family transport system permease protein
MALSVGKSLRNVVKNRMLHGILIILLFWYLTHLAINSSVIPSPYNTVIIFFRLLRGELLLHLLVSLYRILIAIIISLAIGIPLGIIMGLNRKVDSLLSPITYLIYPIPKIAFLPVFLILLGFGDTPKITLVVTIIIFQIQIAVRDAIKEIPSGLFYSVRTLGLSRIQTYRHLIIPAILPKLFSSVRITIGISISVLFFSENFATVYGIGYFIMNTFSILHYEEMFAGILGLSLMGLLIFKLIDVFESRVCPWIRRV